MARLIALLVAALLAFVSPGREAASLALAWKSGASVAIAGNSVIRHRSVCDDDPANMVEMLGRRLGQPVTDLSGPGQPLEQSIRRAAVAIKAGRVETLVMPVSAFELADADVLSLQDAMLYRALAPELPARPLLERALAGDLLSGRPAASLMPFTHDGVEYPDYDGIKARYFAEEKKAMPCPENAGRNRRFIAAYSAHSYTLLGEHPEMLALAQALDTLARARDVRLHWVLLPIDLELIGGLDPALERAARAHVQRLREAFAARGMSLADLSATLGDEHFADRWCACGHLQDSGRARLADDLAKIVGGAVAPTARAEGR